MKFIEKLKPGRRTFIKQAGTLSLAALGGLGFARTAGAENLQTLKRPLDGIARGRVFLDTNAGGHAAGRRGMAGVLVSNGKDIAVTSADGSYELPVEAGAVVFVIKPRGYSPPLNTDNLPQFYYIHEPEGTPDGAFNYKGIEPTGALPGQIDFTLQEHPEGDELEVLVTADPQSYNLDHLKWYGEEALREFGQLDVACGIALGDIVGDHLDLLPHYCRVNASAGIPWHCVIGNHDLNFMAKEDRHAEATFKRLFGPTTYAFQRGPVHFILMNNVYWEGYKGERADGWPRRGQYHAKLRPAQLEFVRNYLQHVPKEERIVVCTHIPLVNLPSWGEAHHTPETKELMEILSSHPHTMSLSGHNHVNYNLYLGEEQGYRPSEGTKHHHMNLTATCGSWYRGPYDAAGIPVATSSDGSPKGYAVIRFKGGNDYHVRFKGIGLPENYQMRVTVPKVVQRESARHTEVHVNVFNAGEQTRVRMRVNGGDWREMERRLSVDPAYAELVERNARNIEAGAGPLSAPTATDHNWKLPLAASLTNGWHKLDVEATNDYGDVWIEVANFVVADTEDDLEHLNNGTRRPRQS